MKRSSTEKAVKPKINPDPQGTLRIGMKVRSYFLIAEMDVIRTLTYLKPSLLAEGGLASADGGDSGTPIEHVAAAWFLPVDNADGLWRDIGGES